MNWTTKINNSCRKRNYLRFPVLAKVPSSWGAVMPITRTCLEKQTILTGFRLWQFEKLHGNQRLHRKTRNDWSSQLPQFSLNMICVFEYSRPRRWPHMYYFHETSFESWPLRINTWTNYPQAASKRIFVKLCNFLCNNLCNCSGSWSII